MARENGLVDQLGYLDDAIAAAAKRANLVQYSVKTIEKPLSAKEQLLRELTGSALASAQALTALPTALREFIVPLTEPLSRIAEMNDPRHIYAQCLSCTAP